MSQKQTSETGMSLVEMLVVLVIIGLMSTLAIMTLGPSKGAAESEARALARNLNALSRQAVLSGDMRGVALGETEFAMLHYDGLAWRELGRARWPSGVDIVLPESRASKSGSKMTADILFEPTGIGTPFAVELADRQSVWTVASDGTGQISVREGRRRAAR